MSEEIAAVEQVLSSSLLALNGRITDSANRSLAGAGGINSRQEIGGSDAPHGWKTRKGEYEIGRHRKRSEGRSQGDRRKKKRQEKRGDQIDPVEVEVGFLF